jgi:hypothetical protein
MPKPRAARPIAECLDADASMARLAAHARRLLMLQRCLESASPPALAKHCRIANYKLGIIVIHANNSAVASKIRQLTASLGCEFVKTGIEVTEIRVRVQPQDGYFATRPSPNGNSISEGAKSALTSLSERLPSNSPLKSSLDRMIRRSRGT